MGNYLYKEDIDSQKGQLLKVVEKEGQTVMEPDLTVPLPDESETEAKVNELSDWKNEQQAVIPDEVIKGVKEIENFLANTSDNTTLVQLLNTLTDSLVTAISRKQDIIADLSDIRRGASAGATALANLVNYYNKQETQAVITQVLDTFEVDEDTGDITIQYDDGNKDDGNNN